MKRRNFIKWSSVWSADGLLPYNSLLANTTDTEPLTAKGNDRLYWVSLIEKIASPILTNISKGELRKNMEVINLNFENKTVD